MDCSYSLKGETISLSVVPQQYGDTTNTDRLVPTNTVMVIDISASMNGAATVTNDDGDKVNHGWSLLDIVKHASNTVARTLGTNDRLSIVTFSDNASVLMDWTYCNEDNKSMIENIIKSMKSTRSTNYTAGLTMGLKQFEELEMDPNNMNSVFNLIFFTDGQPTTSYDPPRGYVHLCQMLQAKLKKKVNMTTIGLGNQLDSKLLAEIAPFGFIYLPDPGSIGNSMCNLVAYTKTIVFHESSIFSDSVIRIYPPSALKSSIAYNITNETSEFVDILIGPIIYDIPRIFVMEVHDFCRIELVQQGHEIQYVQSFVPSNEEISQNDEIRSRIVEALNRIHLPINTDKLTEFVQTMNTSNPLFRTMTEEMLPGLLNNYSTWGKHYLVSLPPMLRDQRRSNFRDACLQEFNKAKDGSDSMFEVLCNQAEQIFAITIPPEPSLLTQFNYTPAQVLPNEFLRGGGCWHKNGIILVNVDNTIVPTPTYLVKPNDLVFTQDQRYAKVICIIKRYMRNIKLLQIGDLLITEWHPVFYQNSWTFPHNITTSSVTGNFELYDFVLEDSHIVMVDNVACVTLGHNFDLPVVKHDFYGTDKIIHTLKKNEGWKNGFIEINI